MRFWDSSALVPLVLDEPSSEAMRRLWRSGAGATVWWGTIVECASVVARSERVGALRAAEIAAALGHFQRLRIEWQEIEPTERLRELAQSLLRVHSLRAADALQLAAAYIAADAIPRSLEFVCLDTRLRDAAAREGFVIIEP